jgi:hypothetical protein
MTPPPAPRLFTFVGGSSGTWQVERTRPVVGEPLPATSALSVLAAGVCDAATDGGAVWRLRGIVSNQCYVERAGKDERRQVFEAQSQHIAIGLRYLPAIAERRFVDREADIRLTR